MHRVLLASWLVVGSLVGCSSAEEGSAGGSAAEGSAEAAEHAPAGAEPGSYEDWCAEHAVPESMCTRCNPSLAPAFQATGDWCAEHGLPESQCLACNPDLRIVRPTKRGG